MTVITSYSIHYPKLYEAESVLWIRSGAGRWEKALLGEGWVITSYSIHYPKLYEAPAVIPCATPRSPRRARLPRPTATPRMQQMGQFIGAWVGPIVVIVVIFVLHEASYNFG